jgi:hypothetical protein
MVMAYFPNGTAGDMFEEEYCNHCVHEGDYEKGESCPVMLAHILYAYELCNKKEHPGKVILDMLIPEDKRGFPEQCAMFLEKPPTGPARSRG